MQNDGTTLVTSCSPCNAQVIAATHFNASESRTRQSWSPAALARLLAFVTGTPYLARPSLSAPSKHLVAFISGSHSHVCTQNGALVAGTCSAACPAGFKALSVFCQVWGSGAFQGVDSEIDVAINLNGL